MPTTSNCGYRRGSEFSTSNVLPPSIGRKPTSEWMCLILLVIVLIYCSAAANGPPNTATFIFEYPLPKGLLGKRLVSDMCWINEFTLGGASASGFFTWKVVVNVTHQTTDFSLLDCYDKSIGVACLMDKAFYTVSPLLDHVRVYNFSAGGREAVTHWFPAGASSPGNLAVNEDMIIVANNSLTPLLAFNHSGGLQSNYSLDGSTYWYHSKYTLLQSYLYLTSDGLILASRKDTKDVVIYSMDTNSCIKIGGTPHSGPLQFSEPCGIQDVNGNYFLVADRAKNKVYTYGKDGTYQNTLSIVGDVLRSPRALAIVQQAGRKILALSHETAHENSLKFYELTP